MLPTVWLNPGILVIYGAPLDTGTHKHHAIQLVWPAAKTICRLDDEEVTAPLIINTQVEHQLRMDSGWVLLVEPQSNLGQHLAERLSQFPTVQITESAPLCVDVPQPSKDPSPLLSPLFSVLGFDGDCADITVATTITDDRIRQLLSDLDLCMQGDCLKPSSWRASEAARKLALSEGRFLHLFRQQMGIAWRPYLLWRRLICAINAILKGASATDSAHLAGFSDSAHLSRTFRSMFGMSIREAQSIIRPS